MADEGCGLDPFCKIKDNLADALANVAGNALQAIADAVTSAVATTIAQLGTIWTTIDAGDLSGNGSGADQPSGGVFNDRVDTLLGYTVWIGLGVSVMALILLAITIATNARRGDGTGLVNAATIVFAGATLIGGATSVVAYIVPARAVNVASPIGFIQDQTFYLTLALAIFSTIIAGARMVWTQRADPAQDLLKGLLTLAVVSASGVALLNILLQATDALAEQIIGSAIGADFTADVQTLLGLAPETPATWIGGNVMLIIVGGLIAVIINIVQIMLMVLRTAMLFLLAGVLPLSASFMNTEAGKSWFAKIIAWTIAFAFYKPAAALIYATGIKLSESGLFAGQSLLQFCAGLILIIASVVALPVLIGFLSPALGAMSSSGGGVPLALTPQSLPAGAQGRSRGNGFPSAPVLQSAPNSRGTGVAGIGGPDGRLAGAAPPVAVAAVVVQAAKKGVDAISDSVQSSVQQSNGSPPKSGAPSGNSPGTRPAGRQPKSGAQPNRPQPINDNGNEGSPDGADR